MPPFFIDQELIYVICFVWTNKLPSYVDFFPSNPLFGSQKRLKEPNIFFKIEEIINVFVYQLYSRRQTALPQLFKTRPYNFLESVIRIFYNGAEESIRYGPVFWFEALGKIFPTAAHVTSTKSIKNIRTFFWNFMDIFQDDLPFSCMSSKDSIFRIKNRFMSTRVRV